MYVEIPNVSFAGIKNLVGKETGKPFRLAELRHQESFTKVDLFVSDKFNDQHVPVGSMVNARCEMNEKRNLSLLELIPVK